MSVYKIKYNYDPNAKYFKNVLRALKYRIRTIIHQRHIKTLENICFNTNDIVSEFFKNNSHLPLDLLRQRYGCTAFSRQFSYDCFARDLKIISHIYPKLYTQKCIKLISLDDEYGVWLSIEPNMINEGMFLIKLSCKNTFIYNLNFITLNDGILITCLQGCGDIKEYLKDFTKKFFGLRPISFMIFYIFLFAKKLNLQNIYGVDDKFAISSFKRGKKRKGHIINFHNLDDIYKENCEILDSYHGYKKLKFVCTPIEQISSHKRSMYKKRYLFLDKITNDNV